MLFDFQGFYSLNLTLDDDKFVRIFPSGDYKKDLAFNDDVDKNIFKIVLYGTLVPT